MKKIILLFLVLTHFSVLAETWGPKIKIHTSNDVGQVGDCYIGVDEKATDAWDKDVVFHFDGKQLKENEFLPPMPPPGTIYCVMVRDSLLPFDSYTYTDFRGIPENLTEFMHKYRLEVMWGKYSQKITIRWGKLPAGIDSAKFRCYEWLKSTPDINMKEVEEVIFDNNALQRFDFKIYYNKNNDNINELNTEFIDIYPNIVENDIYINHLKFNAYEIISSCGAKIANSKQTILNDKIKVSHLAQGIYFLKLFDRSNKIYFSKFIKK